ncbi:MAG: hypothetical protein ACRCXZ_04920 [Patescibacteria group bacterium]
MNGRYTSIETFLNMNKQLKSADSSNRLSKAGLIALSFSLTATSLVLGWYVFKNNQELENINQKIQLSQNFTLNNQTKVLEKYGILTNTSGDKSLKLTKDPGFDLIVLSSQVAVPIQRQVEQPFSLSKDNYTSLALNPAQNLSPRYVFKGAAALTINPSKGEFKSDAFEVNVTDDNQFLVRNISDSPIAIFVQTNVKTIRFNPEETSAEVIKKQENNLLRVFFLPGANSTVNIPVVGSFTNKDFTVDVQSEVFYSRQLEQLK